MDTYLGISFKYVAKSEWDEADDMMRVGTIQRTIGLIMMKIMTVMIRLWLWEWDRLNWPSIDNDETDYNYDDNDFAAWE